jgi:tetratricopeptide (TPR) repeat protein
MRLLYSIVIVAILLTIGSSTYAQNNLHKKKSRQQPAAELFVDNKATSATKEAHVLNLQGLTAMREEDFSTAEKFFSNAHSIDPNNTSVLYNLSTVYLISGKSSEALKLLAEGRKNFPDDAHLTSRLGDVYFTMKALVLAQKTYQRAYNLDPTLTQTALRLTTTLILLKKNKDAEKMLDGLLARSAADHRMLGAIAALYFSSGNIPKGIKTATQSLQLHPTKEVYISLGSGYQLSGDKEKALDAFTKAAAMGQPTEELKRKIQELS